MGWCFIILGMSAFALPTNYGNLMMGASFVLTLFSPDAVNQMQNMPMQPGMVGGAAAMPAIILIHTISAA